MINANFLRAIESRVASCAISLAGDELIVKPRDSPIKDVAIPILVPPDGVIEFRGYVNLSDFTDIWTEIITHSFRGDDFNLSEVFIALMGFEASLRWSGFLRKTATFISNPRLRKLGTHISSLRVKDDLVVALNDDAELLNLIKLVEPIKIHVKLTDSTSLIGPHRRDKKKGFEDFLKYIRDPNEIVWEVDTRAPLLNLTDRSFNQMRAEGLIDLMNLVSRNIVEVVRHQVASL